VSNVNNNLNYVLFYSQNKIPLYTPHPPPPRIQRFGERIIILLPSPLQVAFGESCLPFTPEGNTPLGRRVRGRGVALPPPPPPSCLRFLVRGVACGLLESCLPSSSSPSSPPCCLPLTPPSPPLPKGRGKGCCLIFWGKGKVAFGVGNLEGGKGKVASPYPKYDMRQLGRVRGVASLLQ